MANSLVMVKHINILLFIFFISISFSAQDVGNENSPKYDLALFLLSREWNDISHDSRIKLELRKKQDSKIWLKSSFNISSQPNLYDHIVNITSNDSISEERRSSSHHEKYYLQLGLDHAVGDRQIFSIGGGLILGYGLSDWNYWTSGKKWSSDTNLWESIEYENIGVTYEIGGLFPHQDQTRSGYMNQKYFLIGLELNLAINAPISNRFQIGMQVSPQYVYSTEVDYTKNDPINILNNRKRFGRTSGFMEASIRYNFGGIKSL